MTRSVLFLPDSGPGVGGGHVLRCLPLARALRERGAECAFAVGEEGALLVERFGDGLFPAVALDQARIVAGDAVVFDNYGLDAEAEAAFAAPGRVLMAIDDLADRPHAVDLLLDPSLHRRKKHYAGKVPANAGLLLGPDYALLRPAFRDLRRVAFEEPAERVRRIFVSFGLSDVEGVTARTVALVRGAMPEAMLDVALSGHAHSLPELQDRTREDARLRVHVDALNVADLMARADLAVGAGGSATWERCCLGLPTLAVTVADNQRKLMAALADIGVVHACDLNKASLNGDILEGLVALASRSARQMMRVKARRYCDGRGAERAADALLSVLDQKR